MQGFVVGPFHEVQEVEMLPLYNILLSSCDTMETEHISCSLKFVFKWFTGALNKQTPPQRQLRYAWSPW